MIKKMNEILSEKVSENENKEQTYNPYIANGYANRKEYLQCMSEDYDLPLSLVYDIAQLLGKNEDFDGLISSLEDAENIFGEW